MDAPHFVLTTPVLPWRPDQGSKRFLLETARGLHAIGRVTWVTRLVGDQTEAVARLRDEGFELNLDDQFLSRDPWSRMRRRIGIDWRAWRRKHPRELEFVATPRVRALVRAAHRDDPTAIGVAAYWSAAPVLEAAPAGRRVLVAADVESEVAARGRALGDRSHSEERVQRLRQAEARAFATADLALCLTDEDIESARRLVGGEAGTRFDLCPVAVPVPSAPLESAPRNDELRLLAYGHWEAAFNRDGLLWFLDAIWPALRDHPARPRLRIVGRGAPQIVDERVDVVGFVPELDAELARCDTIVIPLRYAGGFRYRLIEAMGAGRAVVATPVAAVGCRATPGVHYEVAETVDAWRAALERLADTGHRDRMRIDAHAWVRNHHSPADTASKLRAALGPVLDS